MYKGSFLEPATKPSCLPPRSLWESVGAGLASGTVGAFPPLGHQRGRSADQAPSGTGFRTGREKGDAGSGKYFDFRNFEDADRGSPAKMPDDSILRQFFGENGRASIPRPAARSA